MKKLFILQYSPKLDKFQLQEVDNPLDVANFQIPIIDAPNQSIINLSSHLVDTEKIECSFPDAQVFANPHNDYMKAHNYGLLYNGFAILHPDFAPTGWRVPNLDDYNQLFSFVDVSTNRVGVLIENNLDYNAESFNGELDEHKFSIRAAGHRAPNNYFQLIGQRTYLATSVVYDVDRFYAYPIYSPTSIPNAAAIYNHTGISVRLIKEDNEFLETMTDIEGNIYPCTQIGEQVWTRTNWKCTRLDNGTEIANLQTEDEWEDSSSPGYCAYNNDLSNA